MKIPQPTLQQQDPAGNLGLLLFRLAAHAGQAVCPQEWPLFAPWVEDFLQQKFDGGARA